MKKLFSFSQKEISETFKKSKPVKKIDGLKLIQMPIKNSTTNTFGKILIVIPKKSGKAHERNLIKRRIKEIFYKEKLFEKPIISIILVYKSAITISYEQLKEFLTKCF